MAPSNIPRVKQRIRALDLVAASRRARAIMDQLDDGRIAACSTISTPWLKPVRFFLRNSPAGAIIQGG